MDKELEEQFNKLCEDKNIPYLVVVPLFKFIEDNFISKKEIKNKIEKIEKLKNAIRKQTGAFKYDDCYDDCIKIIKELLD